MVPWLLLTDALAGDEVRKVGQGATLVLSGFQTGNYLGTALWYGPTKRRLTFPEYVRVQGSPNGLNTTTVPWEPLLAPLTVGANVVPLVAGRERGQEGRPELVAHAVGLALNVGVLVPMLAVKAPVSSVTDDWTPDQTPPPDWTRLRSRWETANLVQGLLSLGALAANTTAVLVE